MVYTRDRVNELINKFLQTIKLRHSIEKTYLFGSHAKGTADIDSDIDLALVLTKIDNCSVFDESFEIYHGAQKINPILEPICFTKEEFDDEFNPIVHEIKSNVIKIL